MPKKCKLCINQEMCEAFARRAPKQARNLGPKMRPQMEMATEV